MKKTKRSLLIGVAAMGLVAASAGAVSTFAWYTNNQNATVNANTASGNLTTTKSTVSAGTYSINFTVTPAKTQLELSHVASSDEASSGVNGIAAASLNAGDLIFGAISNGTATMRKCEAATNFITSYSITASWASTPTEPADVAYLGGKSFTINLSVTGKANLLANDDLTGQSNATTATAVVHIAASTLALTVDTISKPYVHIEPTSLSAAEDGTVGAVVVDAASGVTLS